MIKKVRPPRSTDPRIHKAIPVGFQVTVNWEEVKIFLRIKQLRSTPMDLRPLAPDTPHSIRMVADILAMEGYRRRQSNKYYNYSDVATFEERAKDSPAIIKFVEILEEYAAQFPGTSLKELDIEPLDAISHKVMKEIADKLRGHQGKNQG